MTAITEDTSGRIWISTDYAVAAYDGEDFSQPPALAEALLPSEVEHLYCTPENRLVIGQGQLTQLIYDLRDRSLTTAKELPESFAVVRYFASHPALGVSIFEARDGRLLVRNYDGRERILPNGGNDGSSRPKITDWGTIVRYGSRPRFRFFTETDLDGNQLRTYPIRTDSDSHDYLILTEGKANQSSRLTTRLPLADLLRQEFLLGPDGGFRRAALHLPEANPASIFDRHI